jgi:alpha-tubulin suppressor-like RCC1 family protein
LKASQRHIVCIYDEVLTDQESSSSATRRTIVGWGAARHGQLSIESAHSSNNSSPISLQRKTETPLRSSPSSSPSHLKRGSALSRNSGNLPPRGNLKLKKGSYPAAFKKPMQIEVLSAFRNAGKPIPHIASVSVGAGHTVILLHHPIEGDTYEIIGLGNNLKGQIELSEVDTEDFSEMDCTWNGTLLLKQGQINTEVWMIGSKTHGQLGSGTQIDKQPCKVSLGLDEPFGVVDVACGSEHIILVIEVMTGSRHVMTWGWNEHGNLGLGQDDKTDRWAPKKVDQSVLEGGRVLNAWAGCGTSWLLVEYKD